MPKTLLVPLCALLLLPATASAAPAERYDAEEGARVTDNDDGTRAIVIEDDESVEGELLESGFINIHSRRGQAHRSLITIRGQFTAQLIALSNDI